MKKRKHSRFVRLVAREIVQEDKILSPKELEKIESSGSKVAGAEQKEKEE